MMQNIPLSYVLIMSTLMFFIGVYGFITRRNLIVILMSIELILNAVNINFVAFNHYLHPQGYQGHFFALIVIGIAAAEAAVGIAIIINIYRNFKSIDAENVNQMKY